MVPLTVAVMTTSVLVKVTHMKQTFAILSLRMTPPGVSSVNLNLVTLLLINDLACSAITQSVHFTVVAILVTNILVLILMT